MKQVAKFRKRVSEQTEKLLCKFRKPRDVKTITGMDLDALIADTRLPYEESKEELYEALSERVTRLNSIEMSIIRMKYYEGAKNREIARVVGMSEWAVGRALKKAIERMK